MILVLSGNERTGQPGEKRHVPDRIDRRPEGSKIFANLDQERRHVSVMCVGSSLTRTADQARGKVGGVADRTREKISFRFNDSTNHIALAHTSSFSLRTSKVSALTERIVENIVASLTH